MEEKSSFSLQIKDESLVRAGCSMQHVQEEVTVQVHLININSLKGPALRPLVAAALSNQIVLFVGCSSATRQFWHQLYAQLDFLTGQWETMRLRDSVIFLGCVQQSSITAAVNCDVKKFLLHVNDDTPSRSELDPLGITRARVLFLKSNEEAIRGEISLVKNV